MIESPDRGFLIPHRLHTDSLGHPASVKRKLDSCPVVGEKDNKWPPQMETAWPHISGWPGGDVFWKMWGYLKDMV